MFNHGKQRVTCFRDENDFYSKQDKQKARNEDISNSACQTFSNNNDIYLVEQVRKQHHWNEKLELLIKWLGYLNRQNTWEPEGHLSPALIQEYFQQSSPKKPMQTNTILWLKFWRKEHQSLGVVKYSCIVMPLCAGRDNKTLTKVDINHWKIPHLTVVAYSQTLSNNIWLKRCSATIDTTLYMVSCILHEKFPFILLCGATLIINAV